MATLYSHEFNNFLLGSAKEIPRGLLNLYKNSFIPLLVERSSTKKLMETEFETESMSDISLWEESANRSEVAWKEGFSQSWPQIQMAGLIDIPKKMEFFCQIPLLTRLIQHLKLSSSNTMEQIITNLFEYADSVNYTSMPLFGGANGGAPFVWKGGDGLTLFNTAHTWQGTDLTYPNQSASFVDPTEDGVNTQGMRIARLTNDRGKPLNLQVTKIMFPIEQQNLVSRTYKTEKQPGTNLNDVNTSMDFTSGSVQKIRNPWLSDTGDYYLGTNAQEGMIKMKDAWRDDVQTSERNPRTGNKCISLDSSFAIACLRLLSWYKVTG